MFKWIFLAQVVVYLLLMPSIRRPLELGYYPPLGVGILVIIGLAAGFLFAHLKSDPLAAAAAGTPDKLQPRPILTFAIPALAVLYAVIVVAFGLLNRRQGSEFMAELYSGLPIYVLAIVRGYEILFVPLALGYAFSQSSERIGQRIFVGIALVASLPFMGVADSRGRLLVLAVYMLCFVRPAAFVQSLYRNARVYIAAAIVVGTFVFFSMRRSEGYNSLNDYLLLEVYQRLDGLSLVTDLRDAGLLDRIGQFDLEMFTPLLAKLAFLDAAREAKLLGRTSTKQYYLQDLLGRNQLDYPNSMATDPLYFAGWAGIVISFCILGFIISKFDRLVVKRELFADLNKAALSIAFVTAFALFENDFVGAVSTFFQNYLFTLLLLFFGFTRTSEAATNRSPAGSLIAARTAGP